MMSKDFDLLSDRRRYASNRRASLFSHYSTNDKFYRYVELLSLEVDIEGYLKRKIGFSEWDRKWDLGVFRENNKNYILLSKKNNLGSYEVLERVELTNELKPVEWLNISLKKYLLK